MFGYDLTWAGWLFVIDFGVSVPIWLWRAQDVYQKTPIESILSALACVFYLVLFFTVGFVE